ncbi:MAG TPA: SRPBCC family protein [Dehalococcoidia bacterium]|nr:SRPBCC family protein [Dehalococcoidia bacterium]
MKAQGSIEIAAPPEKIWALLTKRETMLQSFPWCERFDFVGEQRSGVGSMFYMVQKVDGRTERHLCEVTEWEENKKLAFHQVLGDVKKLEVVFTIEATETGSRFALVYNATLPGWIIGKIIELFVGKRFKKEAEEDLANIKRLAEA